MPGMCVRNRSLVFPTILEGNRFLLNFIENRGSERWCDFFLVSVSYWENWNPYWVDWALHSTQHSIVEHQSRNRKTLQKSRRPQISLLSPSIGMTGSYLWREQLQWSDISARMFCSFHSSSLLISFLSSWSWWLCWNISSPRTASLSWFK